MKLEISLSILLAAVIVNQISVTAATSEPVCSYRSIQDDTVFLKYFPLSKKGEEYVDFGLDGKCVKRATCSETFKTDIEECKKFPVTCSNKNQYKGVFPACCVKC